LLVVVGKDLTPAPCLQVFIKRLFGANPSDILRKSYEKKPGLTLVLLVIIT